MDDATTLVQFKLVHRHYWAASMISSHGHGWSTAKEEPKYFPCRWDHLRPPFLHRWHLHAHSEGAASLWSRPIICLPTHWQTQRNRSTEDCPGGPSRHWKERSGLPGKLESWCFQHNFLPHVLLPPEIYEIFLSRVETMHHYINKYFGKKLGVSPCFTTVGPDTASIMLPPPLVHCRLIQSWTSFAPHDASGLIGWRHAARRASNENHSQVVSCYSGARSRSQPMDERSHWSLPDWKSWHRKHTTSTVFPWGRQGM